MGSRWRRGAESDQVQELALLVHKLRLLVLLLRLLLLRLFACAHGAREAQRPSPSSARGVIQI